jgi:hypothetical protein
LRADGTFIAGEEVRHWPKETMMKLEGLALKPGTVYLKNGDNCYPCGQFKGLNGTTAIHEILMLQF